MHPLFLAALLSNRDHGALRQDQMTDQGTNMPLLNALRGNAAGKRFSIRRREKRDADALFCMFSQPLCRRGMTLEPFSSAGDV
jgi:putative acetyltransferase